MRISDQDNEVWSCEKATDLPQQAGVSTCVPYYAELDYDGDTILTESDADLLERYILKWVFGDS